jgi:hypothetical protein
MAKSLRFRRASLKQSSKALGWICDETLSLLMTKMSLHWEGLVAQLPWVMRWQARGIHSMSIHEILMTTTMMLGSPDPRKSVSVAHLALSPVNL